MDTEGLGAGRAAQKLADPTAVRRKTQIPMGGAVDDKGGSLAASVSSTLQHARLGLEERLDVEQDLREAAEAGDYDTVQSILASGTPADSKLAGDGTTALMMAASRGHVDVAKLLLQFKADLWAEDRHHEGVLVYAFKRGQLGMINFLVNQGAEVDSRDASGRTLLMLAAAKGDPRMVSALLYEGADPEAALGGGTALVVAVRLENVDAAQVLLESGASTSPVDSRGKTPLMFASVGGCDAMVTLLMEFRADPNTRDLDGHTAMEQCGGDEDIIEAFNKAHYYSPFQWTWRSFCVSSCGSLCNLNSTRDPNSET